MNQYIDFTILKPFATVNDINNAYKIATNYNYYGFCFPSFFLNELLKFGGKRYDIVNSQSTKLVTVIGFPLGYQSIEEKVQSILSFSNSPPDEIDFVINLSAVQSQNWKYLNEELQAVKKATEKVKIPIFNKLEDKEPLYFKTPILKAIIESPHWDEKTLEKICFLCIANGIDFIKTSTGFLEDGITFEKKLDSIKLIKQFTEGSGIKIKISGGIKSKEMAQEAIKIGVDRIGTSSVL